LEDRNGLIFGVMSGPPVTNKAKEHGTKPAGFKSNTGACDNRSSDDFKEVLASITTTLNLARGTALEEGFVSEKGQRGNFNAFHSGVSMGAGRQVSLFQTVPSCPRQN